MNKYCLGLIFDPDQNRVLLLSKRSTDQFNPGLWNGIGGKVEKNETSLDAMVRETFEEASFRVDSDCWTHMGVISDYDLFHVDVFASLARIDAASQATDELIGIFDREQAQDLNYAASVKEALLPWLEGGMLLPKNTYPC